MITGNNPANLEGARSELGPDVFAVASDASDAAAQKELAEMVKQAFGKLDVLFLNAFTERTSQRWRDENI
jgi:NAD(P)-dependent dehydrogenase (short-subunit alcohol dehydrogenase family)